MTEISDGMRQLGEVFNILAKVVAMRKSNESADEYHKYQKRLRGLVDSAASQMDKGDYVQSYVSTKDALKLANEIAFFWYNMYLNEVFQRNLSIQQVAEIAAQGDLVDHE